ncbi:MAG: glycerate kinase, partial [Muribaculaceae bacterium]|nr:glycerate kinase [Muribaculaceae bacterium]
MVLDAVDFNNKILGASFVITGEGRIDRQTCMGKAPTGVLRRAQAQGIPVIAIGGTVDKDALTLLTTSGFHSVCEATPPGMNLAEAMTPTVAMANIRSTIKHWIIKNEAE